MILLGQNKIQSRNITIITKDLDKQLVFYINKKNLIEKLAAFKHKKFKKHINLTKEFLTDPLFLKFADFLLKKNSNGVYLNLEKINNKIFTEIAMDLKIGNYKIGSIRKLQVLEFGIEGIKKNNIALLSRKDQILQNSLAILLDMIYEKNQSAEFKWNLNHLVVLLRIKCYWVCLPYYIEIILGQLFTSTHCHILINTLKKKINDKRFLDLFFKMYNCFILCPGGFYLEKQKKKLQVNFFSFILCNIFLFRLDVFIRNIILMLHLKQKDFQVINSDCTVLLDNTLSFKLKNNRNLIYKSKIKYIRYRDCCLLGIKGSYNFVYNLKKRLVFFFQSTFHFKIQAHTLKIINTYCNKVKFLGFIIYNSCFSKLLSKKSVFVNKVKHINKSNFILNNLKPQQNYNISNIEKFLSNVSPFLKFNEHNTISLFSKKNKTFVSSNYLFFIKIVFKIITYYLFYFISLYIKKNFLTCTVKNNLKYSNIYEFADLYTLILIANLNYKGFFFLSWGYIQNLFLQQFKIYFSSHNIKKNSLYNISPTIVCDFEKIQKDLITLGILNQKKKSICLFQIISESDFCIVQYYKKLAFFLLHYYCCADNFYKIQNFINFFLRASLVSTLKYKYKISSTNMLFKKFSTNLYVFTTNGLTSHFLTTEEIFYFKKNSLSHFVWL